MLIFLIVLFVVMYIGLLLMQLAKFHSIQRCLEVLDAYLASAKPTEGLLPHRTMEIEKGNDYSACLDKLLIRYPIIEKHKTIDLTLGFGRPDEKNYENAYDICCDMLMVVNRARHKFISLLNPVHAIKQMFLIPANVLALFGFKFKSEHLARFVSLIGWALSSFFVEDVRSFAIELFQNVFNR